MLKRYRAFTMIELMFVIGLASIVFFIAIPNYNMFRQRQACGSAAMQFKFDCVQARQNAILVEDSYLLYEVIENGFPVGYTIGRSPFGVLKRVDLKNQYPGSFMNMAGSHPAGVTFLPGGNLSLSNFAVVMESGVFSYGRVIFTPGGSTVNPFCEVRLHLNGEIRLIQNPI